MAKHNKMINWKQVRAKPTTEMHLDFPSDLEVGDDAMY